MECAVGTTDLDHSQCWCWHVFGCGYAGRTVMHRVGRRHDIEMCQCLMKAGYPSASFSYPSGRRTSSLRSIVDRNGRHYARGHVLSRWLPRCCGECRMTSTLH